MRVQSDKEEYKKQMASILQNTKGLTVIEDACTNLLIENQRVTGVHLKTRGNVLAQAVILTTGTYMTSTILRGHTATGIRAGGSTYDSIVVGWSARNMESVCFA